MSRRAGFFAKRSPPPEPEAGDRVRTAGWARNCPWNRGPCSGRRTDSGSGPRARYSPGASCLSFPFKSLRFAAAAQQRGGVVLQISHGVDPIGAGTELVLHMDGKGVEIALGLRFPAEQGVQIAVLQWTSPRPLVWTRPGKIIPETEYFFVLRQGAEVRAGTSSRRAAFPVLYAY